MFSFFEKPCANKDFHSISANSVQKLKMKAMWHNGYRRLSYKEYKKEKFSIILLVESSVVKMCVKVLDSRVMQKHFSPRFLYLFFWKSCENARFLTKDGVAWAMNQIYLDNAATTKPLDDVVNAMMPYLKEEYGNPGAIYSLGKEARDAVGEARSKVAEFFGCEPEQVIFTSGGSEGNNFVFRGLSEYLRWKHKMHILVSSVEHDSVFHAASALAKDGFEVEYIPVSPTGEVRVSDVENMIRKETGLVSVMYVNNETGAVNPVEDIGAVCAKRGVLFHADCVQAAGAHKIDVRRIGCDFATMSGHKIHSVKGVGAIFVKEVDRLNPLIYGGAEQEFGYRGGTENVPGIVALGKACEISNASIHENMIKVSTTKQIFYATLKETLEGFGLGDILHINGPSPVVPGKILNIRLDGVDAQTLLLLLSAKDIFVSAGSACRSHEAEPSHVLTAMGLSRDEARSSIRVSFSTMNTRDEVIEAAKFTAECASILIGYSEE